MIDFESIATGNPVVVDMPEGIRFAQMCARRGALRLEIAGMKRRGRSAYSICKEAYAMKGSRERVLAQMNVMIDNYFGEKKANADSNVGA